jgi:glutaredoxin
VITVEIFTKAECCLCEAAKTIINKVNKQIPFLIREIDITSDKALYERFKEEIPVIFINGKKSFKYTVSEKELRKRLRRLMR